MSRITDGSGIPLDPSDLTKLRTLKEEQLLGPPGLPRPTGIQHYLSLTLNNGELEYSINCVQSEGPFGCESPGEFEACGYNEWLSAAGIENTHDGVNRLSVWPVAFDRDGGDHILMTFI